MKKSVIRIMLAALTLAPALWLCSCNDEQEAVYDPSKPVVLDTFYPTEGGIATKVIIEGSNFGCDVSKIHVRYNDMEAAVISSTGDKIYAIWHPGFGGTYEVNGNVVPLRNFYTDNSDGYFDELTSDVTTLYFEDYGTFDVSNADAEWDGYFQTFSVGYEGAPVAVPFDLVFRSNNVICENGKKVEASEAGVGVDFYLENEGLTAVGNTATLYKDGVAMSFIMTFVDGLAVSFLGGSSLITEPGTYTLEVPAGTYKDAAGKNITEELGRVIVEPAENTVIRRGLARSIKTPQGYKRYSKRITCEATAYTHTGYRTATGIMPYVGVVAVDPRYIPLGTKMFIPGYGMALAADTGGDMIYHRIDGFLNSEYECIQWGRRNVEVYILED